MVTSSTRSTLAATSALVGMLLPVVVVVAILLVMYMQGRELDLRRRDRHALAAIARQLDARLGAARLAWAAACPDAHELARIDLPGLRIENVDPVKGAKGRRVTSETPCAGGRLEPTEVHYDNGRLIIGPKCCRGTIDLDEFLRGSNVELPGHIDGILLTERKSQAMGRVVGRLGAPYGTIRAMDDLAVVPADPSKSETLQPSLLLSKTQKVLVGGEEHTLYAERVIEAPPMEAATKKGPGTEPDELLVVALVGQDRLASDRWVLPYWWVIGLSFVLVLAALSWPILKLWFMSVGERLRAVDVRVLVVTSVLAAAVISIAIIGMLTVWAIDDALDMRLRALADDVEHRLETHLDVAGRQWSELRDAVRPDGVKRPVPVLEPLGLNGGPSIVIDPEGNELQRWQPTPNGTYLEPTSSGLCLSDRQYFRDALAFDLPWRGTAAGIMPFTVEVVRSKLTSTDMLGIASPLTAPDDLFDARAAVLTVSRYPTAFRRPILPAGFSFALVNAQGRVQLHADSARNLDENLIDEVGNPDELRAILASGQERLLEFAYAGKGYRAYVRPLRNGPWTIVALRELQQLQQLLTEIIARWAFIFLTYVTAYLALLATVQIIDEGYQVPWLWPARGRRRTYAHAAAARSHSCRRSSYTSRTPGPTVRDVPPCCSPRRRS